MNPNTKLTVLTALPAVFPLLVLLLLQNGVPWGGTFQPGDDLTHDLIGETPLALFGIQSLCTSTLGRNIATYCLDHSGPSSESCMACLFGANFGTGQRQSQRKITTFIAAFVAVVTVGHFRVYWMSLYVRLYDVGVCNRI